MSKYFLKSTIEVFLPICEVPDGFVEESSDHPCLHVRHMTIDELLSFDSDGPAAYPEKLASLVLEHSGNFNLVPATSPPPDKGDDLAAYREGMAQWLAKSFHFKALGMLVRELAAKNRLSDREGN